MLAGISIKPGTELTDDVLELAKQCDLILIMTVEPGFGGQKFMQTMMPKVKRCREVLGPDFNVQVDGGLSVDTIRSAAEAGANCIVAGSAVFKRDPPPKETIQSLRNAVRELGHGIKDQDESCASSKKQRSE